MPYIVNNEQGILINSNLYLGPETMNMGTQSDAASASNYQVYSDDSAQFILYGDMFSDNFYINRGLRPPVRRVTGTVSPGVSVVTALTDHIIIASFSSAQSNDIWLGTASRVEGKELIFRRVDGSTATVTIRSSQTDIDDGSSVTGNVSSLNLGNNDLRRLVRINGLWVNMNFGK